MSGPSVVFLLDCARDLTLARPLAYLTARETGARLRILPLRRFERRDPHGAWRRELARLAREVGATIEPFEGAAEASALLQGGWGVLVAASESSLPAHADLHEAMLAAPPGYLRVTMQHGLECAGFLRNRAHDAAHGLGVTFAADVLCAWMAPDRLSSLAPSQRAKVLVTGPSFLLQRRLPSPPALGPDRRPRGGLVCETLHSARMRGSAAHGLPFMETFSRFHEVLGAAGEEVALRPHPGGQDVLRTGARPAGNVALANEPLFRTDLGAYEYGISGPSTVVLHMVLAGLPTAVWQDAEGAMDASTFDGLVRIGGLEDWLTFARDARARPEMICERQRRWLDGLGMPLDPAKVYRRWARLLATATTAGVGAPPVPRVAVPRRVLVLDGGAPSPLRAALASALAALEARGEVAPSTLSVADHVGPWRTRSGWTRRTIARGAPDLVVLCGLGPAGFEAAGRVVAGVRAPLLALVDEAAAEAPAGGDASGPAPWWAAIGRTLSRCDLVLAATLRLRRRLREMEVRAPIVADGRLGGQDRGAEPEAARVEAVADLLARAAAEGRSPVAARVGAAA